MPNPATSEEQFIELFETYGAAETARRLKLNVRSVQDRRARLENKFRRPIKNPHKLDTRANIHEHKPEHKLTVKDGIVLVGSDSHYWPGNPTVGHRAFVKFVKDFQPVAVIKNGDELDGSQISRHPPIGWESRPSLIQELEATKERLDEIRDAWKGAKFIWPLGNHDARFETRLATVAPEYADIYGVHLKDHFPEWEPCWACWINEDVVVKHRFKNGVHATHNNTLWSGKTIITGHLHSLKVTPFTDYNGTRYGVDCGCIADPKGPQFRDYLETNPTNWRSGFIVLTFVKGRLMWPEVVSVIDKDSVEFRGKIIHV